ncbi:MAG: bifunctional serine/threonine-protein kinase/formylglycine-generating enzyme family protein [Myxococcota bacterium]
MTDLDPDVLAELRALAEDARLSEGGRKALMTPTGRSAFERLLRNAASQTMVPEMFDDPSPLDGTAIESDPIALEEPQPRPRRDADRIQHRRYQDLGVIGQGGMGEVHRARDPDLNRRMALKILRADQLHRTSTVIRFIEEAQITAQLAHPAIVPVYDFGRLPDGRYYFTMKEIRGQTLSEVIREVHDVFGRSAGWNVRRLLDAFLRVCEALAYAHDRGVVHRDIKPSNIMLGEFGEVLVLDWGLAKVLGRADRAGASLAPLDTPITTGRDLSADPLTRAGRVSGTPNYMPPEQAAGLIEQLGPASDVYSLGAVLFEILAGYPPFGGTDTRAILQKVRLGQRHILPREHHTPDGIRAICDKAMALRPADRYPDAQAMFAALRDWLEGASRRSEALVIVGKADAMRPSIDTLRHRARALRQQADARLAPVPAHAPETEKVQGWALQDEADNLDRKAALAELAYIETLQSALKREPGLREAHQRLADHYRERHAVSEANHDLQAAALEEALLRTHDRGRHSHYLDGTGQLNLITDPPGARVLLFGYQTVHRRLQPQLLGGALTTPIVDLPLAMGSYLLVVQAPGRMTVRYPIWLGRQDQWSQLPPGDTAPRPLQLPLLQEMRADEVYVPEGWFRSGGDRDAYQSLPGRTLWADAFFIQRDPVTNRRFLDFLNDLVDRGEEGLALRCAPRERSGHDNRYGPLIYGRDGDGRFFLQPDAEGDLWQPDWPVVMIDRPAAALYASWLSKQTGLKWRLPTAWEREKAARGVDGRSFPWGDFADPSWSCTQTSLPERATLVDVGAFPVDASPYGMRHGGGMVRDWCATVFTADGDPIIDHRIPRYRTPNERELAEVRGGSWTNRQSWARCALRFGYPASSRFSDLGFRLVRAREEHP